MPTILITGVSTGIGRASALRFQRAGWRVIGTVRNPETAEHLDGVELEALDLAVQGSAAHLAERVLASLGCPDVILNNAGMLQFGPLEYYPAEELERLYRVNVFSQLELVRPFLPSMRERGSGVIANVTSLGGLLVFPFFGAYNSTKWAMEGISEGLWHELKPFGVRVKAIEPGFVETAIWGKVLPGADEPVEGAGPYRPYMEEMRRFESSITSRTTPEAAAEEVFSSITDDTDRLRYPISAYARPMSFARRVIGDRRFMRFFHRRWMGPKA
ncbi:MAG TPA: SDR family oxidoreductase [Coriobacteriia bacterium]|nr:SDR family oxidoreductase [Coriobacteriia bacterium]